jgi:hypothetical protein
LLKRNIFETFKRIKKYLFIKIKVVLKFVNNYN